MTSEYLDMTRAFGSCLDDISSFKEVLRDSSISRPLVLDVATQLAADGWLGAATEQVEHHSQPLEMLAELAEAAGKREVPLVFPLLETWTVTRLLHRMGEPAADLLTAVVDGRQLASVDLDSLCSASRERRGLVPFAQSVDFVVILRPNADKSADVVCARFAEADWSPGSAIDLTSPVASYARESGVEMTKLGELNAHELALVSADYLVLQTADIVGCASGLFDRSLNHLATREQFGRTLDRFQALQHRAADLFVRLESSRSLLRYASWSLSKGQDMAVEHALMAKGYAGEECWRLANEAIQFHGGMGYSWETKLHFATRRIAYRTLTGKDSRRCLVESGSSALKRGTIAPIN